MSDDTTAAPAAEKKITQPFAEFHQIAAELEAVADPTAAARTAAELREAQRVEYGRFIAAQDIDIDGARAFNIGQPVPQGHVSDDGPVYPGQVALRPSEEDLAAVLAPGPAAPVTDPADVLPAGNATAEVWRAYAETHGVAPADAALLGRDELRARFTS